MAKYTAEGVGNLKSVNTSYLYVKKRQKPKLLNILNGANKI